MVDLDKQFAAMADVSEEDTAYDFVIDEDLRVIAVPERGVVLGVEGDKDANRIRFRMNKTWRGYDMSKFDLRINYQNANGDKNYYTVTSKHTEGNTCRPQRNISSRCAPLRWARRAGMRPQTP